MLSEDKLKLLLEIVRDNPSIDVDKLVKISSESGSVKIEPQDVPDVVEGNTPKRTRTTPQNVHEFNKRYSVEELNAIRDLYEEFGRNVREIPRNRIKGLANTMDRSYTAIVAQLHILKRYDKSFEGREGV